jgi:hypothetical protein
VTSMGTPSVAAWMRWRWWSAVRPMIMPTWPGAWGGAVGAGDEDEVAGGGVCEGGGGPAGGLVGGVVG